MKTQKQYESSARNFAIGFVCLFIIAIFLTLGKCSHAQETGYHIVIKTPESQRTDVYQALNLPEAEALILAATNEPVDVAKALGNSPYYRVERLNFELYIEVRRVVITRSGKVKFKRVKVIGG